MTCEVCNWKDECIETRRTMDNLPLGKTVKVDNAKALNLYNAGLRANIIGMVRGGLTVQQVRDRAEQVYLEVSE